MIEASNETFEQDVSKGVVLIDFYADWCAPCKAMAPTVEKLQRELPETKIVKVNVDEIDEHIPVKYGVRSVPTFILLRDGQVVGTKSGIQKFESLCEWVESGR